MTYWYYNTTSDFIGWVENEETAVRCARKDYLIIFMANPRDVRDGFQS